MKAPIDDFHRGRCQRALLFGMRSLGFDVSNLAALRDAVAGSTFEEDQVRLACSKHYPFGAHGNRYLRTMWLDELDKLMDRLGLYPPDRARWPAIDSRWTFDEGPHAGKIVRVAGVARDGEGVTRVVLFHRGSVLEGLTIQRFLREARKHEKREAADVPG